MLDLATWLALTKEMSAYMTCAKVRRVPWGWAYPLALVSVSMRGCPVCSHYRLDTGSKMNTSGRALSPALSQSLEPLNSSWHRKVWTRKKCLFFYATRVCHCLSFSISWLMLSSADSVQICQDFMHRELQTVVFNHPQINLLVPVKWLKDMNT